ncbi:MAG: type 4a pilus biogenesis protein PilO [Planctomycetota bacterium]
MAASDWSERTRMLVTVAMSVVVNVGLGFWLYTTHADFKKKEALLVKRQDEIRNLKKTVEEEGPKLATQLSALREELHTKESKLPDAEQVEKLMNAIGTVTAKHNARLENRIRVMSAESAPGSNYARMIWKTKWKADFMTWCKLINEMEERFERFISFENLTITPKNNGLVPMGTQHDIQVDVVTYRYLPKT